MRDWDGPSAVIGIILDTEAMAQIIGRLMKLAA